MSDRTLPDRSTLTREYLTSLNPALDFFSMGDLTFRQYQDQYLLTIELDISSETRMIKVPLEVFENGYVRLYHPLGNLTPEETAHLENLWESNINNNPTMPVQIVNEAGVELFTIPPKYPTEIIASDNENLGNITVHHHALTRQGCADANSLQKSFRANMNTTGAENSLWESFNVYYGLYAKAEEPETDGVSLLD